MVDIHPHQRIRFSHHQQFETLRSRPRVYRSIRHHRLRDSLQAEEGLRGRTSGIASGRSHGTVIQSGAAGRCAINKLILVAPVPKTQTLLPFQTPVRQISHKTCSTDKSGFVCHKRCYFASTYEPFDM